MVAGRGWNLRKAPKVRASRDEFLASERLPFPESPASECLIRNCHLVSVLLCELGADNLKLISCIDGSEFRLE